MRRFNFIQRAIEALLVPVSAAASVAEIESLIERRALALRAGNVARAQGLSDRLEGMGVALRCTPQGTYWSRG